MESPGGDAVKAPRGASSEAPTPAEPASRRRTGSPQMLMRSRYERRLLVKRLDAWCARQTNWKLALLSIGFSLLFWLLIRAMLTWLVSPPQLHLSAS
jgi:hypothetical protein